MSSTNVGIEEARKRLGDLITAAQQGADVTITRNGKPAARIIRFQEDIMTVTDRDIREQVGSGLCRVCGGLALYDPVPNGPWWTHDDPSVDDHRVVIDPDTTSYGPHGVRPPGVTPKYAMGGIITALDADSTLAALHRAEQELADVDEAAGRDIAKPDEPLLARVADLRRGRTEATQRALELAAELASSRQELDAVRNNLDRQDADR